jgi:hypothetical protein
VTLLCFINHPHPRGCDAHSPRVAAALRRLIRTRMGAPVIFRDLHRAYPAHPHPHGCASSCNSLIGIIKEQQGNPNEFCRI